VTSPHFAWLPPEINSALLYAGPGSAPLHAAAEAWDGLAENLASSASSFFSVVSDLANGSWQGPSATAMLAVATQYVSWLRAAAAQAEATSSQAEAIAGAFETALSATVQPAVVSANRALVRMLASSNHLGQNAPTIMDIESAYEQMWATDVAAMSGYHADASAAAEQLAPWQHVLQNLGMHFGNGDLTFAPHAATGNLVHHLTGMAGLEQTGGHAGSWVSGDGQLASGGLLHSGSPGAGFAEAGELSAASYGGPDAAMLGSGHYVTGGVSATNLHPGLLNSVTAGTGFNPDATHPGLLNPALANTAFSTAPTGAESGSSG
jgi:PPE-repeat protein